MDSILQRIEQPAEWDELVERQSPSHLLQSWSWGELKRRFGWRPYRFKLAANGQQTVCGQVLIKSIAPGIQLAYMPKGPLGAWDDAGSGPLFFKAMARWLQRQGVSLFKIEPPGTSVEKTALWLQELGFIEVKGVQPRQTIIVDLSGSEEELLNRMKQKTRYNIRLAEKKGIAVRAGDADDLAVFQQLAEETARRDGFAMHSLEYHHAAYDLFSPERATLLMANYRGETLAGIMVFRHQRQAYYLYGASSDRARELMPNYLLQWEAMRRAKAEGCLSYDLWGIPDASLQELEESYSGHREGLWGVYRFKRGFGGEIVRFYGAFDMIIRPARYRLYQTMLQWRRGKRA